MKRNQLCSFAFAVVLAIPASAGLVIEAETDGSAVNNSVASAQAISMASFTTPAPAEVFNPSYPTATIQGGNGGDDVDFFSFVNPGGWVYLDMDNSSPTFDPLVSLFDANGTLIAYGDDSDLDNGSVNTIDSFLGGILLPAGTYYIGISQFANLPTSALTAQEDLITRPDGGDGGLMVSGAVAGVSTYDFNNVQPGGAFYTLNVSLQSPVPEPTTYALVGIALVCAGVVGRNKNKQINK